VGVTNQCVKKSASQVWRGNCLLTE